MNRIALALPLLALGSAGCLEAAVALQVADALDRGDDSWDEEYYEDDYYDDYSSFQSREVIRGDMGGTMPANGEFDREVTRGTFWSGGDWVDFEVHATGSAWAMIGGSFDTSRLEDGVPTELSPGEFDMIGCSGPVEYDYAYDGPADTVVVTEEVVEIDGSQALQYTFVGTFSDNGGSTTTTVVVPMPDED